MTDRPESTPSIYDAAVAAARELVAEHERTHHTAPTAIPELPGWTWVPGAWPCLKHASGAHIAAHPQAGGRWGWLWGATKCSWETHVDTPAEAAAAALGYEIRDTLERDGYYWDLPGNDRPSGPTCKTAELAALDALRHAESTRAPAQPAALTPPDALCVHCRKPRVEHSASATQACPPFGATTYEPASAALPPAPAAAPVQTVGPMLCSECGLPLDDHAWGGDECTPYAAHVRQKLADLRELYAGALGRSAGLDDSLEQARYDRDAAQDEVRRLREALAKLEPKP